ncbi:MAG: hypothetical protein DRO14_00845 [Thermoprotei archaeon]|mgnify:CR=1 FL=1|nr:MAG: hypothetical protein DRO14_00845 [Thermoprotei archaeon]
MTEHSKWELLSWEDINNISKKPNSLAILPVGSIEQHGPHLPVGTDFLIADKVAEILTKKLNEKNIPTIKLPPIPFGLSSMWQAYPGTVTLRYDTFAKLIIEVLTSVIAAGFSNILILNSHVGNSDLLRVAAREAVEHAGKGKVAVITIWEFIGDIINTLFETPFFHADEAETSVALALGISLIREPVRSSDIFRVYNEKWHSLDLTRRPKAYVFRPESRTMHGPGAYGRPDKSSKEKGDVLVRELINRLVDFVNDFIEDKV